MALSSSPARSLRTGWVLCCALVLLGCPTPSPDDAGMDTGGDMTDAPERPDVPRVDAGRDGGPDAGRETDCMGSDCAFVELELAGSSSCVRRMNGDVICWGEGEYGQLGDTRERHLPGCPVPEGMPVDCSSSPVLVVLPAPATEIDAADDYVCASTGTGRTHYCWGERGYPIDTIRPTRLYTPIEISIFSGAHIDEMSSRACWYDAAGAVSCIGSNGAGQLGIGTRIESLTPVAATRQSDMMPITGALEVEGGTFSGTVCARTATEVLCWGTNEFGQLGDGIADHPDDCGDAVAMVDCALRAVPVMIDGSAVTDLGVGFGHVCALMDDGTVECWGSNALGQLGTGDNALRDVPTPVAGVTNAVQLSVNANTTCVRLMDERVSCWGQSDLGQVGDGAMVHMPATCSSGGRLVDCQLSPVFVMGIDDATELSTGFSHSCVLRETGSIACWGRNDRYQLGDGTRDTRFAPVPVAGL